eukprot:ctg_838.g342
MTTDENGRVAGTVTQRAHAAYTNDDAECGFVEAEGDGTVPNFFQQYSQTYFCRLAEVRRFFQQAAPDAYVSLSEVPTGTASTVIGVIYKQMPLKPSVLREYAGDVMLPVPEVERANYVSDEDRVFIEDETGRTELCLASAGDKDGLVSGVVMAVRGTQMEDGRLRVEELRYPPTAPLPPPPPSTTLPKSADASVDTEPLYACFLSDIDPTAARAQLLLDYLTGNLGIDLPRRCRRRFLGQPGGVGAGRFVARRPRPRAIGMAAAALSPHPVAASCHPRQDRPDTLLQPAHLHPARPPLPGHLRSERGQPHALLQGHLHHRGAPPPAAVSARGAHRTRHARLPAGVAPRPAPHSTPAPGVLQRQRRRLCRPNRIPAAAIGDILHRRGCHGYRGACRMRVRVAPQRSTIRGIRRGRAPRLANTASTAAASRRPAVNGMPYALGLSV